MRTFSLAHASAHTVLVQGLPPSITPTTLHDTFEAIFPDAIEAHCVYDVSHLSDLLNQRQAVGKGGGEREEDAHHAWSLSSPARTLSHSFFYGYLALLGSGKT